MTINAIVTMPPYAPFIKEVVDHPLVSGLRLNTVMPIKESLEEVLKRLQEEGDKKDMWIDLKCRQLRVVGYWSPPFTEITVGHKLSVHTPVTAYFNDGKEVGTVLEVDENRLIMQEGPKRVIGPGESINIIDPSLTIEGYLTDTDKKYIEAAQKVGVKEFMLSYVESAQDIATVRKYTSEAVIIAKIESKRGLEYLEKEWNKEVRLMAARGDLYIEIKKPHDIIKSVETIIAKDQNAIVASRLFPSLSTSLEPSCADIGDVDNLLRMGYKTFMFGDDICMERNAIISGLNLLRAMAEHHETKYHEE